MYCAEYHDGRDNTNANSDKCIICVTAGRAGMHPESIRVEGGANILSIIYV